VPSLMSRSAAIGVSRPAELGRYQRKGRGGQRDYRRPRSRRPAGRKGLCAVSVTRVVSVIGSSRSRSALIDLSSWDDLLPYVQITCLFVRDAHRAAKLRSRRELQLLTIISLPGASAPAPA
jgi:hypothetical protein